MTPDREKSRLKQETSADCEEVKAAQRKNTGSERDQAPNNSSEKTSR
jgi:hypothetical protein